MTEDSPKISFVDYLETLRRRRLLLFIAFGAVFSVIAAIALLLPDVYRSSSEMRIELEGPSIDIFEPLELTTRADQYVRSLEKRVITTNAIEAWLQDPSVLSRYRENESLSELVYRVRSNIRIDMISTTVMEPRTGRPVDVITGFQAAFHAHDPNDAKKIAEQLGDSFLAEDRSIRTEQAAAASSFLREEIETKRERILELESQIADFKEANTGRLPDFMAVNLAASERIERELQNIETEIRALRQDRIFRETQLEQIRQETVATDRLNQLDEEYRRAMSIYGDDHPDVIRIRRQIDALTNTATSDSSQRIGELEAALAEARQQYSEIHPDVISLKRQLDSLRAEESDNRSLNDANPSYLQLQAQVNAIGTQLSGLEQRRSDLREDYDELQDRMAQMPQIERELLALNRDLQTEQLAFDDLRRKLAQAQQTESFETGERGARIIKVNSASLPSRPVAPPRVAILILGFVFATSVAIGTVLIAEMFDGSVRNRRDIELLFNAKPIAEIPVIATPHDVVSATRLAILWSMAVLISVAIVIVIWRNF